MDHLKKIKQTLKKIKQTKKKTRRARRPATLTIELPPLVMSTPGDVPVPAVIAGALTGKQARFVAEYLIDLNAAGAARRAGYSEASAEQQGYENLRKPEIAAAITEGKARQLDTAELSAARVLEELRRLAFVNVRDYFDPVTGDAKHPHELTLEQGACLAGFEVLIKNAKAGDGITDTIHKFKLWDKVHSLELLAKHFALLVEKIEIKSASADARVARLVAARKRVAK
jgi:phage terminase small subunit